ncbi:hypothetical protein Asp14428_58980 [Actinoplanes sp. NBRC 14428]|uniref:Uncharacterized protein n=1 Tax=Pseudosporangium ferrugineum TaxID=439699 RepID=A0A2T0SDM1_9ACTN|nr:hypothetical protein [Pseudosporangium ferrugineum]PRY31433.1 hypothetical protein CLV70_103320 [Pseudosporangium ferrugineum]BCJ54423.1 hypothetical protein Asp14428_58980 [Actinoplanes sp. NBRC 14428]
MTKQADDEEYGVALLRPLAGEPDGPARIDVARAMRDGRRRRLSRWWASGTAVVALTATAAAGGTLAFSAAGRPAPERAPVATTEPPVTAAPAGPRDCRVTRLPTDGVRKALVTGGDPTGTWLAGRTYPKRGSMSYPLVLWRDGKLAASVDMSGSDQSLEDLNSHGDAVGFSFDPEIKPWSYAEGKLTALAGGEGAAVALNDKGVIVGSLGPAYEGRPARWSSRTAQPESLPMPAGMTVGTAVDIDEDGTVVGTVEGKNREGSGYLWLADGTARKMPLPDVDGTKATMFWPEAIRNGWVVGRSVVDTKRERSFAPFRYRVSTGRYERLPADAGLPQRVAANGWVLGTARLPVITSAGGVTTELPAYPKAAAHPDYLINSYSDDGLVAAGYVIGDDIQNQPLLWRCR